MTQTNGPKDEGLAMGDDVARDGAGRVQRRTIVQGAAWTIPVIAGAAAAPLAAASNQPQPCTNSRLVVQDAAYIRDDSQGWYGELQSNATGARLGVGGILPSSRIKTVIRVRNPTNCQFTGVVRIQIDLPVRTIAGGPTSEQGWAYSDGGTYTKDGLTYRRYNFTGTASVAPNTTDFFGVNWTLASQSTLRTYLGAQQGPQRWTVLTAAQRSMGWRLPNPPGTITIDGQNAYTGYNNTLAQNAGYWIHSNTVAA